MWAKIKAIIWAVGGMAGGLFFFLMGRQMQANKTLKEENKSLKNQANANQQKFASDQQIMQKLSEDNADVRTENVTQKLNDYFNK